MKSLEEMKKELESLQKKKKEIWKVIPEFPNYEASNYGRVRSKGFTVYRPAPTGDKNVVFPAIYKGKILSPLKTGIGQQWVAYRIIQKQGVYKQISAQKLMLSAFLNVPLSELPRHVYKIDKTIDDISLRNTTFVHRKK